MLLKGTGISIDAIFGNVTSRHYRKEYSGSEIKDYFSFHSPDFSVDVRM